MAFTLAPLPYAFDALEPHIDARTMEIHHDKHHAAYTNNLNAAIAGTDLENLTIEGSKVPTGALAAAIDEAFGSFEKFKEEFTKAGVTRFGSGWAWLCVHKGGKVDVCSTANQDVPLMPGIGCGGFPILGMDVWEHAYYLHYQNRRPDYITAFFNVINWDIVGQKYEANR